MTWEHLRFFLLLLLLLMVNARVDRTQWRVNYFSSSIQRNPPMMKIGPFLCFCAPPPPLQLLICISRCVYMHLSFFPLEFSVPIVWKPSSLGPWEIVQMSAFHFKRFVLSNRFRLIENRFPSASSRKCVVSMWYVSKTKQNLWLRHLVKI